MGTVSPIPQHRRLVLEFDAATWNVLSASRLGRSEKPFMLKVQIVISSIVPIGQAC